MIGCYCYVWVVILGVDFRSVLVFCVWTYLLGLRFSLACGLLLVFIMLLYVGFV